MANIQMFKINKLHGTLTFNLKFNKNKLILLGENGSCKTTIIKMLFYTLTMQFNELYKYDFESIEIGIDNDILTLHKAAIDLLINPFTSSFGGEENNYIRELKKELSINLRRIPYAIRYNLEQQIDRQIDHFGRLIDTWEIEHLCDRYDLPYREDILPLIQQIARAVRVKGYNKRINQVETLENKQYTQEIETFSKIVGKKVKKQMHILYLPTYRRIEQEIVDEDLRRSRNIKSEKGDNYTILKEFGMRDVDDSITETLSNLRESSRTKLNELTLSYLGDIVKKQYISNDFHNIKSITPKKIDDIMERVNESILSQEIKETLKNTLLKIKNKSNLDDHEQILCYYFLKLEKYNNELIEQEKSIKYFVEVCKHYLTNKDIVYDGRNFEFTIKLKNENAYPENKTSKGNNQSEYSLFSEDIYSDKEKIHLKDLSSGEKQIVSIFSHLYLSAKKNIIVLIDEPELSLSVEWQRMFLSDVTKGKFCKGLVAVTHSPFIFENDLDTYAHALEEFKE